jgi:hypothetical protein
MQEYKDLPDSLPKTHHALEPYIKQRPEVTRIRQILAAHLSSHVHQKEGQPIFHPLSLVEASSSAESTLSGIKGLQREYIRCLRANIKARQEFAKTSKEHQLKPSFDHPRRATQETAEAHDESISTLTTFVDVVKYQRKYERLRIMQDYVDTVALKSPATTDHLGSGAVLKDIGSLPQVPPEVMGTTKMRQGSEKTDLKELVDQLEKAVLRAKLLLKREQTFLARIKGRNSAPDHASSSPSGRLQALGTTRNELINWIETELAKTGDSSPDSEDATQPKTPGKGGKAFIDSELVSIQRQYSQYSKLRRALILAATGKLDQPTPIAPVHDEDEAAENSAGASPDAMNHIMHSYLVEMMSISNEQKVMIQQKSHFTISLAKHLKEAGQGVDRLSEESHLLPAHPMPVAASHGSGLDGLASFARDMSSHEKPDSSRRARAWVFAADAARAATKDAVLDKLEKGRVDVRDAQQTLLALQRLVGDDDVDVQTAGGVEHTTAGDVWASLAGNLGAIKMGELGST